MKLTEETFFASEAQVKQHGRNLFNFGSWMVFTLKIIKDMGDVLIIIIVCLVILAGIFAYRQYKERHLRIINKRPVNTTKVVFESKPKLVPLTPEQFEKAQYCRQIAQLSIINSELREDVEKQRQEIWELKRQLGQ